MTANLNPRPVAVAKTLVDNNLAMYDRLMRERPGAVRDYAPNQCKDCPYFHPEWEHRFCLYASCKYGKSIDVFNMKRLGKKQNACVSMER